MRLAILTPNVTALSQPTIDDIAELADRGCLSVISNRPEGETPDQPEWCELKAAAAARNMEAVQIPVIASQISEEDIDTFRQALERLPKPIAAFCRTGTFDPAVGARQPGQPHRRRAHRDRRQGRL